MPCFVPKKQREVVRRVLDHLGIAPYSRPLKVRVLGSTLRGMEPDFVEHIVSSPLPPGSFQQLMPRDGSIVDYLADQNVRILVDGPKLSALSFAGEVQRIVSRGESGELSHKVVPVARTMGYLGELCGTFARGWDSFQPGETAYKLNPILTLDEFRAYVGNARNVDGLPVARTAAQWSADGQDSPMEVLLRAVLVMRPGLGGLHLPPPSTNEPLPLSPYQRKIIKHDTITPDMWWELFKLIFEYDGPEHYDPAGVREDKRRIQDYQALGYSVFPVTAEDVRSIAGFDRFIRPVAHTIARTMEKSKGRTFMRRINRLLASPDYRARRSLLLSTLNLAD